MENSGCRESGKERGEKEARDSLLRPRATSTHRHGAGGGGCLPGGTHWKGMSPGWPAGPSAWHTSLTEREPTMISEPPLGKSAPSE